MIRLSLLSVMLIPALSAEAPVRELIYSAASLTGGQVIPRYDKGYLLYLDVQRANHLEVHKPDGTPMYNVQLPCPGTGDCGANSVAVDSRGTVEAGINYRTPRAWAGGIRFLNAQGVEARFITTGWYVPRTLCFDEQDNLWSIGWLRDPTNPEFPVKEDHPIVRKYSSDGKELGRFIARSLWPGKKSSPGSIGSGYWHMFAAPDRVGAIIHEDYADNVPEWVEWDLNGNLLGRTRLPDNLHQGRGFTSDGKFYARFVVKDGRAPELRVLDKATGNWTAVAMNLSDYVEQEGIFLLGAHGKDLVYRLGFENVRVLRVEPGTN